MTKIDSRAKNNKTNAIGYESLALMEQVNYWASKYQFVIDNHVLPRLSVTAEKLVLCMHSFSPLYVDFNSSKLTQRKEASKQGLIRACKPASGMRILDVTAGWGRDAVLLASFGADVLMVERQPIMAALLEDGLKRRYQEVGEGVLSLLHMNAIDYLKTLSPSDYPDVIYIDPMHPLRQKSALVKKDMQALQTLFGPDEDAQLLIEMSCAHVKNRVVVKWPERLTPLSTPNGSIRGKTVRFDIFTATI